MANVMLTTVDNPYDPFVQFDEWLSYDALMGYDTCGFLARMTITSYELSDVDQELAIDDAIEEIVRLNPNGLFRKAIKE